MKRTRIELKYANTSADIKDMQILFCWPFSPLFQNVRTLIVGGQTDKMQHVNKLIHLCSSALLFFLSYQTSFWVFVVSREDWPPFLKHEEARLMAESAAPTGPYQYVLCAATSPAVKQQDESLTYLNQGKPRSPRRNLSQRRSASIGAFRQGSCLQPLLTAQKIVIKYSNDAETDQRSDSDHRSNPTSIDFIRN